MRLYLTSTGQWSGTQSDAADAQRAESLRRISIEEEIQSCDLPRLAVLAENVAWRFHELARASKREQA